MHNKSWEAESYNRGIKRRQGFWGIAGSSLAIPLVVSFAAGNGWARNPITGDDGEQLHLTVVAHIHAPIPEKDLATAERVASEIFQRAGVELSWVDCPRTRQADQLNPACTAPLSTADIHLTWIPDLIEDSQMGMSVMGGAHPTPPPNRGQIAFICYARAKRLLPDPSDVELTLGQLLGHGIAHEIGHLLLGTNSHSPSGLMSARWSLKELRLAACGRLSFSRDQAVAIRGDVRARRAEQQAAAERVASQK